jgi:hypothetical protein
MALRGPADVGSRRTPPRGMLLLLPTGEGGGGCTALVWGAGSSVRRAPPLDCVDDEAADTVAVAADTVAVAAAEVTVYARGVRPWRSGLGLDADALMRPTHPATASGRSGEAEARPAPAPGPARCPRPPHAMSAETTLRIYMYACVCPRAPSR